MNKVPDILDLLLFCGEKMMVAQCLQYDICIQGTSKKEIMDRFAADLYSSIPFGNLSNLGQAPARFWDFFYEQQLCSVWDNPLEPLNIPLRPPAKLNYVTELRNVRVNLYPVVKRIWSEANIFPQYVQISK